MNTFTPLREVPGMNWNSDVEFINTALDQLSKTDQIGSLTHILIILLYNSVSDFKYRSDLVSSSILGLQNEKQVRNTIGTVLQRFAHRQFQAAYALLTPSKN